MASFLPQSTTKQINAWKKCLKKWGCKLKVRKCEAIDGIIKETESIINETNEGHYDSVMLH